VPNRVSLPRFSSSVSFSFREPAMRASLTFCLIILLTLAAYLGSCFALVQRGWGDSNLGFASWYPAYRFSPRSASGVAGTLYWPAHRLDRRLLRTTMWEEKQ